MCRHWSTSAKLCRWSASWVSKTPHIQNLTVGGVANAIDLDSASALNMDRLEMIRVLLDEVVQFINQVYVVDVCAVAAMYPEWFKIGSGVKNYLAVPDLPLDSTGSSYDLPGGTIMNGNIAGVHSFKTASDKEFREGVSEYVAHAYYHGEKALHPWVGETEPAFTGWDGEQKYSWVKAPRFNGEPMQVGPLAQVLVGYAQGHPLTQKHRNSRSARCRPSAGSLVDSRHVALYARPARRTRDSGLDVGGVGAEALAAFNRQRCQR